MKKDWIWLIPIVFYFAGVFFIPNMDVESLTDKGFANQEEYSYIDADGEEHEGRTLIDIKGIGSVLTYKDVYMASLPIFMLSLIFGKIIIDDNNEIGHVMFANCVLGVLLIWLTSTSTIVSTILFWLGIFAAGFAKGYRK